MRALCLTATGGPEHLTLLDLPSPPLGAPDAVRIGVRAAGLNRLDLWVATGLPTAPRTGFPHIVGTDAAVASSFSAPIVEVGLTEPPVTKDEPSQR